jgi:hypothetical protein
MTKTIQQVAQTSKEVRDFIKANGTLPVLINVAGLQVNRATFLRMMSIAIVLIHENKTSTILETPFTNPNQADDNVTTGKWNKKDNNIDDYLSVAFNTNKAMITTGVCPTLTKTPLGYLSFYGIIETFSRILGYYIEHDNTLPSFVNVKNQFKADLDIDNDGVYTCQRFRQSVDQETGYYCAPFMSAQLLFELFNIDVAQSWLASQEGTTEDGTGHPGINIGIEKAAQNNGHSVNITWSNFSSATWKSIGESVESLDIGLGCHGLYKDRWGHYMFPVYVNLNTKTVGIIDSLNEDNDILYVDFDTFGRWLLNTPYNQPALISVKKVS